MDSSLQKTEKQNPGTCKCNTLHLPAGALGLMPRHICRRAKAGALDDTGVDGRINRLLTSITSSVFPISKEVNHPIVDVMRKVESRKFFYKGRVFYSVERFGKVEGDYSDSFFSLKHGSDCLKYLDNGSGCRA